MRVVERFADLAHDAECCVDIDTLGIWRIEDVSERAAIEPLEDQEIEFVVAIEIDEPHDVRVHEATRLGGLLLQRAQRITILGELRRENLDRDTGLFGTGFGEAPVERFVDDAHAATRDLLLQQESVAQDGADLHPGFGIVDWRRQGL